MFWSQQSFELSPTPVVAIEEAGLETEQAA
jgi:hypothetical protein